jgi:hypothetical protein
MKKVRPFLLCISAGVLWTTSFAHQPVKEHEPLQVKNFNGLNSRASFAFYEISPSTSACFMVIETMLQTLILTEQEQVPQQQSFIQRLKGLAREYVGIPCFVLYDRLRHDGLSQKDYTVIGVTLGSLYGAQKIADHYSLGAACCGDFSKTVQVCVEDWKTIVNYKVAILSGIVALLTVGALVKSALSLPVIERFKRSLTSHQKRMISSDETLRELVDNAHENPLPLANHDGLASYLHDHQRRLLGQAVEKYKEETDPLSLFDDL